MAGIVTSNKTRKLVGNRLKEIDVPTATLNTSLYYADLSAQGVSLSQSRVNTELNAYPVTVKNNASLALTPSANKVGVVYAMNGDTKTLEEFEFQRGSSATFFSSSGVMGLAAPNEPRINFDNGTSKGLLIEPSSSNLFTDSGLANGLASVSPKSDFGLTAVDSGFNIGGLLTKGIRFEHVAGQVVYGYKQYTVNAGDTYVLSVFIKMDDGSAPVLNDLNLITQGAMLSNFQIINYGSGVYRIAVVFVASSSGNNYHGLAKYAQNSTKSFVVTGLQLEKSTILTSYIPTTTAIATRLADKVLSKRPTVVFPKNSLNVKTAEYSTTWMGNGVENRNIVGRNLLKNSGAINLFAGYSNSTPAHLGFVSVSEWGANNAVRVTFSGGADVLKSALLLSPPKVGEIVTASGWFKNNHATNNLILHSNQGLRTITLTPGQQAKVEWIGIEGNGVGAVQIQAKSVIPSQDLDMIYWRLKYERGSTVTTWSPAPEDYIKVDVNGNIEISYTEPIHLQQFSLISRELKQEEV